MPESYNIYEGILTSLTVSENLSTKIDLLRFSMTRKLCFLPPYSVPYKFILKSVQRINSFKLFYKKLKYVKRTNVEKQRNLLDRKDEKQIREIKSNINYFSISIKNDSMHILVLNSKAIYLVSHIGCVSL